MRLPARRIAGRSKTAILLALLAIIGLLVVIDRNGGDSQSLLLFAVLPIVAAEWYVGHWAGIIVTVIVAAGLFSDELEPLTLTSAAMLHYWNIIVRFIILVIIGQLARTVQERLRYERQLARIDAVTGVLNRLAFFEQANLEVQRAQRYGEVLTFAFVDVDDFKRVNDRLGHAEGDRVLRGIAETLRSNLRMIDVVARIGGDEFALLLPETRTEEADAALGRLHTALRRVFLEQVWPVSVSIGAVTFDGPPSDVVEMLRLADTLMYSAKLEGKNLLRHTTMGPDERTAGR